MPLSKLLPLYRPSVLKTGPLPCPLAAPLLHPGAAEVPMSALEEAWLGGCKQMAMALPPDHPMFSTALRELGRWVLQLCLQEAAEPSGSCRPSVCSRLAVAGRV